MDATAKPTYVPKCSICGSPTVAAFRPFCSRRCSDVDLARWLSGSYAIAGGAADADEDGDDAQAGSMAGDPSSRRFISDDDQSSHN